jgi:hypothetical protein
VLAVKSLGLALFPLLAVIISQPGPVCKQQTPWPRGVSPPSPRDSGKSLVGPGARGFPKPSPLFQGPGAPVARYISGVNFPRYYTSLRAGLDFFIVILSAAKNLDPSLRSG